MKTIFITITRGSIIRNYFHTGVISKLLKSGVRIVALVSFYDNKELLKKLAQDNLTFEPLIPSKKIRLNQLFGEMFRGAIFNKTIKTYYKYRFFSYEPRYYLYYPRLIVYLFIKHVPGIKKILRFLDKCINPQLENELLFEKYKPDLVFSTTPHERSDVGVIKCAQKYRIPTLAMPKSWDNLSKILFPVKADHLFVWSDYMRGEAMKYQDYEKKGVSVVGISQFDFYANENLLLSRAEYCKKMKLDPNKKIILYGSTGSCFDENGYIDLIRKSLENGGLENVQVVMRPHLGYKGEMNKFDPMERHVGFVVDRSDNQSVELKDRWDISIDHILNLYNSLYHADVCINIASTLTLDSIACGTPVVNICFDFLPKAYHESISRVYETDYFGSVIRFNATYVARNEEEFIKYISYALSHKFAKISEQKRLIGYFMHKLDGNSSTRLAQGILKFISNNERISA